MTIEEFERLNPRPPCERCGGAVVRERNPNNNAEQVICSKCGARVPWREHGVLNLKQNGKKSRTDYPMGEEIDAVWERFDDRCIICGITTAECQERKIGRQRQHVAEYAKEGHKGPIVPICTECHPIATALQRARDNDRALMRGFIQFTRTHGERPPLSGPGLSRHGVSPDSVRPERQAAVGLLEGLPDDDADR